VRYMLLIYDDEKQSAALPRDEGQRLMKEYYDFEDEVASRGLKFHSAALQPTATATTVRVRDGETFTTDGPFAETKEQLGGYYVLDCKDLDEAIEVAGGIPSARYGSIEIRPIMELPDSWDEYATKA
jgi:hypothetical protein